MNRLFDSVYHLFNSSYLGELNDPDVPSLLTSGLNVCWFVIDVTMRLFFYLLLQTRRAHEGRILRFLTLHSTHAHDSHAVHLSRLFFAD